MKIAARISRSEKYSTLASAIRLMIRWSGLCRSCTSLLWMVNGCNRMAGFWPRRRDPNGSKVVQKKHRVGYRDGFWFEPRCLLTALLLVFGEPPKQQAINIGPTILKSFKSVRQNPRSCRDAYCYTGDSYSKINYSSLVWRGWSDTVRPWLLFLSMRKEGHCQTKRVGWLARTERFRAN
jgi:hypothetical protein